MINQEIKQKGLLWSKSNDCEMYVVVNESKYEWWMLSDKTGNHMVSNEGKYCRPFADERVLSHWKGFQQNQVF
jgi:hypothetical protein